MAPKQKRPVEVVVFQDPRKRQKSAKPSSEPAHGKAEKKPHDQDGPSRRTNFDHKKFKYDVRKLGIHGFNKKDKETAMVDFLVELGAKPPKNRCYHIQEYQKMMKQKRLEQEKVDELERKAGIKKRKAQAKKKGNKDDILSFVDGQAGFYKDGVQFIKRLKKR